MYKNNDIYQESLSGQMPLGITVTGRWILIAGLLNPVGFTRIEVFFICFYFASNNCASF